MWACLQTDIETRRHRRHRDPSDGAVPGIARVELGAVVGLVVGEVHGRRDRRSVMDLPNGDATAGRSGGIYGRVVLIGARYS